MTNVAAMICSTSASMMRGQDTPPQTHDLLIQHARILPLVQLYIQIRNILHGVGWNETRENACDQAI
jgi:hypothetical protein